MGNGHVHNNCLLVDLHHDFHLRIHRSNVLKYQQQRVDHRYNVFDSDHDQHDDSDGYRPNHNVHSNWANNYSNRSDQHGDSDHDQHRDADDLFNTRLGIWSDGRPPAGWAGDRLPGHETVGQTELK